MTRRQEQPETIPTDRQERQGRQRQQRQDISQEDFNRNVFVNCPFDNDYLPLLRPLLFTLLFLGFRPRLASERLDSLESRIEKISELICCSRYSVHDLSRLRAAEAGELYRLNMPFELGIEYGCRLLGSGLLAQKRCLILEKDPHEYQKALSDLSGIDIRHHDNDELNMVRVIRNWFREIANLGNVEGPTGIWGHFNDFVSDFHDQRQAEGFADDDLDMMPVKEYIDFISHWLSN